MNDFSMSLASWKECNGLGASTLLMQPVRSKAERTATASLAPRQNDARATTEKKKLHCRVTPVLLSALHFSSTKQ